MKKNTLGLLVLMHFTGISQANFNYANQDQLDSRINNLLDNIDSTLELQNTAIALLQKKLTSYQKTRIIERCVLSAATAAVITFLITRYLIHRSLRAEIPRLII